MNTKFQENLIFSTPGGIVLDSNKSSTSNKSSHHLPIPKNLAISLRQHIGVSGQLLVKPGDKVLKGQPLTQVLAPHSVAVHASTSGTVTAISDHPYAHPSGLLETAIHIETDGDDNPFPTLPALDLHHTDKEAVIQRIADCGIVGLGGASFPTATKVSTTKTIQHLIVNGVECEPYMTADDCLMQEQAEQLFRGIQVYDWLLQPERISFAIEADKPEAMVKIEQALFAQPQHIQDKIELKQIPHKYPAGGEKQLIQILTNHEVPSGKLPLDLGCLVQNVGTLFAVADAVFNGQPLIKRLVTVTGDAIKQPNNIWTLIGTPIEFLLKHCDFDPALTGFLLWKKPPRIIMGGPMMGFTLHDLATPIIKNSNCILAITGKSYIEEEEQPCIRCGACAEVCPVELLPQQMLWYAKDKDEKKLEEYHLQDCIECGACSYVCPSHIPLVQYYRQAKSLLRTHAIEKEKAAIAKQRYETRQTRLEREQKERDAKSEALAKRRREAAKQDNSTDKIAAALARAKNKQTETEASNKTPEQIQAAAAIARAKAKKARLAKAKKAQQENTEEKVIEEKIDHNIKVPTETPTTQQDKIAAALAKAKAKAQVKAQQQDSDIKINTPATESTLTTLGTDDLKQQKIKAALAKAKAHATNKNQEDE